MGKASRRKFERRMQLSSGAKPHLPVQLDLPDPLRTRDLVLGDVLTLNEYEREDYCYVASVRARAISAAIPYGDVLSSAFVPLLEYVLTGNANPYLGGCHDTSAVLYMRLRDLGIPESDISLCTGQVRVDEGDFHHSWVEVSGKIFDVAICARNKNTFFAGGPLFSGVDLATNEPTSVKFGVAGSAERDADVDKWVVKGSLAEYHALQKADVSLTPMSVLIDRVYGSGGSEAVARYGDVQREFRAPAAMALR